ncbi:MAG: type IV toxin-antitoxin system AbiEi family antitoxin domain-containing protein [Longimicrobiales bacterium]
MTQGPQTARTGPAAVDAMIAELAERQHGVVSRAQLLAAGLGAHLIDYRVNQGRLHRLYRSVYRVGPIRSAYAGEMAVVLACGEGAFISHDSSERLWRLPRANAPSAVHVTVENRFLRLGPAVAVHRTRVLGADERTSRFGIPVTTVARTIIDLAGTRDARELERMVAAAERSGLLELGVLRALLHAQPRRPGSRVLRQVIGEDGTPMMTRSEAEDRFVTLVRDSGLHLPEANVVIRGYEVDCLWRRERVIVEIDGFEFHSSRDSFERDRARDATLTAAGYRVMRVTWRQITRAPHALLISLARLLMTRENASQA